MAVEQLFVFGIQPLMSKKANLLLENNVRTEGEGLCVRCSRWHLVWVKWGVVSACVCRGGDSEGDGEDEGGENVDKRYGGDDDIM